MSLSSACLQWPHRHNEFVLVEIHAASSSPADKISFTECTNEALNFTWSLDIQRYDLEIVKFEYSCINASNVAVSYAT